MTKTYRNVVVEITDGIAWVTLNRPEKRNAMSPELNEDMIRVFDDLESMDDVHVLVLTGAGEAFSAGMDLQEFFADVDNAPPSRLAQVRRTAFSWQYDRLRMFPKPTIAMVNGWCFGGAFTPLVSCDIAVAADNAIFGLSEVNWGILPAGVVSRDLAAILGYRDALFYILTGRTFDGAKAAEMGLVNYAVPADQLRDEVTAIAEELSQKNPATLRAAKEAFKLCREMNWEQARDYLYAKLDQMRFLDPEGGREQGIAQFLNKTYKPGFEPYPRNSVDR